MTAKVLTNKLGVKARSYRAKCDMSNKVKFNHDQIKNVQNTINDHCSWLKDIFQCGINWDQMPRMASNLIDRGEGVAPLHLLIKDHKGWSEGDGTPPPHDLCAMAMLG